MIALLLLALPLLQEEPDPIHDYVDSMRIELAQGKVGLISEVMQLSDDQAEIFWNLYQDYERELFYLGDRRLELMEEFRGALSEESLTDELASDIAARFFALQQDRLALIEKYFGLYSAELSPLAASQFAQLESRFNLMIDLLFSADTPLISAPRVLADAADPVAGEFSRDTPEESSAGGPRERGALYVTLGLALLSLGVLAGHLKSGESRGKLIPAGVCLALSMTASVLLW